MRPEKNIWRRPELVVLVCSKPEEAVLTACKNNGAFGPERQSCGKQKKIEDCVIISAS